MCVCVCVCEVLLDLFHSHRREGRVILPLLKAVELLLSHQCLDDLVWNHSCGFKHSLLVCVFDEAKHCKNVHRQFACVDVALRLVGPPADSSDGVVSDTFGVWYMLC